MLAEWATSSSEAAAWKRFKCLGLPSEEKDSDEDSTSQQQLRASKKGVEVVELSFAEVQAMVTGFQYGSFDVDAGTAGRKTHNIMI